MNVSQILLAKDKDSILGVVIGHTSMGEYQDVRYDTIMRRKSSAKHAGSSFSECYLNLTNEQLDAVYTDEALNKLHEDTKMECALNGVEIVKRILANASTEYDNRVIWLSMDELEEIVSG